MLGDKEQLTRIILVGDSGTGKTSIIRKFTDNEFVFDTTATLGNFHNFIILTVH